MNLFCVPQIWAESGGKKKIKWMGSFFYLGRSIFLVSGGYEYLKINCVSPYKIIKLDIPVQLEIAG